MSFLEFSIDEYRRLLELALGTRNSLSYNQLDEIVTTSLLWRHDVDVSLRQAAVLADVDASLGVRSTFFINLHSDTYNAQSAFGRSQIEALCSMGHFIGIHLDSEFYGHFTTESELEESLQREIGLFQESFGIKPEAFSFHNPSAAELTFSKIAYAGLVNCYADLFRDEIEYVSDSNGYWRHRSLENVLNLPPTKPLQVLTHAEWWSSIDLAPRERLAGCLFHDALEQLRRYDESMAERGRENRTALGLETSRHPMTEKGLLELMRTLELLPEL